MKSSHPLFGVALIFGYILCGVIAFLTVKYVFLIDPTISPLNAIFWGFLGATIVAGIFIGGNKKERKLLKKEWHDHKKLILSISIITSLGVILWAYSMKLASAGSVGLIGKVDVLMALALGSLFLGEKFSRQTIIGTIIALGGLYLVVNLPSEIPLLVVGMVVFMRFLYSMQSFLVKKFGQNLRGISFTFWRLMIMTSFLFITTLITGTFNIPSKIILGILLASQIFGAYIGRILYFEAHKYLGIGHINLLSLAQPVLLLIGAWIFLSEPMPLQKIIGAAILIFGLFIIILEKSEFKKKFSLKQIFATLRAKKDDTENPVDFS